ncbi:hypothetical protein CGH46_17125, partial [Vibrio parahaemolyticus]
FFDLENQISNGDRNGVLDCNTDKINTINHCKIMKLVKVTILRSKTSNNLKTFRLHIESPA